VREIARDDHVSRAKDFAVALGDEQRSLRVGEDLRQGVFVRRRCVARVQLREEIRELVQVADGGDSDDRVAIVVYRNGHLSPGAPFT
jgi:hypothetical protein